MRTLLVLAQSEAAAQALDLCSLTLGQKGACRERPIVWDSSHFGLRAFEAISACIANALGDGWVAGRGAHLVLLVDSVKLHELDPLSDGWDGLLAALILAFPEARWVFGLIEGAEAEKSIRHWHELSSLTRADFDPLLDGTGLRNWVRKRARKGSTDAEHFPIRTSWAAALDDEVPYAYLHAYTAYRFGYRSFAVTTDELARALLGTGAVSPGPLGLTVEDFYLGWPDKRRGASYADLEKRSEAFPGLGNGPSGPKRYFITAGHDRGAAQVSALSNLKALEELKSCNRGGGEPSKKPIAGMFTLWSELRKGRCGPGFVWPPKNDDSANNQPRGEGHSAPGAILMIAEHLIWRAEVLAGKSTTVVEAVRGAVLASSALELLGFRTPTTARDALELKHRCEVFAECQFGGVLFNLELGRRFREIRRDLTAMAEWYGLQNQQLSLLNGEMRIVSRLMTTFSEGNEFDEEEQCRHHMRKLQTSIWFRTASRTRQRWNPLFYLVAAVRVYIECILVSPSRFIIALAAWLFGLTVAFTLVKEFGGARPSPGGLDGFGQALSSFFGAEILNSTHSGWVFLSAFATVMGFVHLGIFISSLYSTVSRK